MQKQRAKKEQKCAAKNKLDEGGGANLGGIRERKLVELHSCCRDHEDVVWHCPVEVQKTGIWRSLTGLLPFNIVLDVQGTKVLQEGHHQSTVD